MVSLLVFTFHWGFQLFFICLFTWQVLLAPWDPLELQVRLAHPGFQDHPDHRDQPETELRERTCTWAMHLKVALMLT